MKPQNGADIKKSDSQKSGLGVKMTKAKVNKPPPGGKIKLGEATTKLKDKGMGSRGGRGYI